MSLQAGQNPSAAYTPEAEVLIGMFRQFEENAKRLENAYQKMQRDFQTVNLELDLKNKLLSHILENLTNAVVAVDLEGRITSFNHSAERLTGLEAGNVVGRGYLEVLGQGIDEDQTLVYTLKTGKHIGQSEKKLAHIGGYPVTVSFATSILDDSDGNRLGALEVMQDVSEMKRMQEEMVRNRTLAALGEMAAAVAHEIRNPLGAMGGFVTLLERDLESDSAKLDLVRKLIKSLSSLNRIVGNLMVYTRPLSLLAREVHFQAHVDQVLDFVGINLSGTGVTIEKRFPSEPIMVGLDPEKTEQMIINLVQNAVHAIDGSGTVTVSMSARIARKGERLFLNGIRVGRIVTLEIADTGKGIREEDLGKIFNPFFTTREDGNGLGLSIVRKIIDLHNGEISVRSRVGEGTVFTLAFPGG